MHCRICGDEENLSRVIKFWSPDDGWVFGRLCKSCYKDYAHIQPKESDYAYSKRYQHFTDVDGYIDSLYG